MKVVETKACVIIIIIITSLLLFIAVASHGAKTCKSKIYRFMHYTVCCLLGTTRQKGWKEMGILNDFMLHNGEVHKRVSIRKYIHNPCIWASYFLLLTRTFQILLCCRPTAFPHSPHHIWGIYHIKGPAFLFSLISSCSVFSAIVSQLFLVCEHLQIFGRQDLGSPLETGDNRSATNSPV